MRRSSVPQPRTPGTSGDLQCQTTQCPSYVPQRDTEAATDDAARAAGWSVWRGLSTGGQRQLTLKCPKCLGVKRSQASPSPEPYDVPLF